MYIMYITLQYIIKYRKIRYVVKLRNMNRDIARDHCIWIWGKTLCTTTCEVTGYKMMVL